MKKSKKSRAAAPGRAIPQLPSRIVYQHDELPLGKITMKEIWEAPTGLLMGSFLVMAAELAGRRVHRLNVRRLLKMVGHE